MDDLHFDFREKVAESAIKAVVKRTGFTPEKARELLLAQRHAGREAKRLLKKDQYWQKTAGTKRKARVAAKAGTPLEPRRKKTRKTGSLSHGTNPAKKGKRPQSGKVTPTEHGK